MKTIYVLADESGCIQSLTETNYGFPDYLPVEVDDDFDVMTIGDYKLVDGQLSYTGEGTAQKKNDEKQRAMLEQIQLAVPMTVQLRSADIPDEQAVKIPLLFKTWTIGETYTKGEIVRYEEDGELYRCGQPEITASDVYKPGDPGTTALYSHIEISEQGYEVWQKWDGVSGIYKQDQIVQDPYDNNNLYQSKIPNNVWGPPHELPDYWKPYTE